MLKFVQFFRSQCLLVSKLLMEEREILAAELSEITGFKELAGLLKN